MALIKLVTLFYWPVGNRGGAIFILTVYQNVIFSSIYYTEVYLWHFKFWDLENLFNKEYKNN